MAKNKYLKNGELQDNTILTAIQSAYHDYFDGAIVEARDTMVEIVNAIDEWSEEN